jgi:hypothetical protein
MPNNDELPFWQRHITVVDHYLALTANGLLQLPGAEQWTPQQLANRAVACTTALLKARRDALSPPPPDAR